MVFISTTTATIVTSRPARLRVPSEKIEPAFFAELKDVVFIVVCFYLFLSVMLCLYMCHKCAKAVILLTIRRLMFYHFFASVKKLDTGVYFFDTGGVFFVIYLCGDRG